jgi:hypothetical protein
MVPEAAYPLRVRRVDAHAPDRESFIDRRSIIYVFRGKHANCRVEATFSVPLDPEAWYARTANGLYRLTGSRLTSARVAARLPSTFVETIAGSVFVNLAVIPKEWDADPTGSVRRIGYAVRALLGSPEQVEWVHISRRRYSVIDAMLS